jgi:hypothetical protein
MQLFLTVFESVPDPRAENARHDLVEILLIAFLAVLYGAQPCSEMAELGCAKLKFLKRFLKLKHGIPSHDTFSTVFRMLNRMRSMPSDGSLQRWSLRWRRAEFAIGDDLALEINQAHYLERGINFVAVLSRHGGKRKAQARSIGRDHHLWRTFLALLVSPFQRLTIGRCTAFATGGWLRRSSRRAATTA